MVKVPKYHVLNFFYDNKYGCALTALINGTRFHVIADHSRLQDRSKNGTEVWREYSRLLCQVKATEPQEQDGEHNTAPLFVQEEELEGSSEISSDSGIHVNSSKDHDEDKHLCDPTETLQRWVLKPIVNAIPSEAFKERTVQAWYYCPTHYFYLHAIDGKLEAREETSPQGDLTGRIDALIPSMTLPKYLVRLEIPMYSAENVLVLQESSDPDPIHPALVRIDGNEVFLKTVSLGPQQSMVKRELQVMKKIEREGLHNEIRVPLLRGLVRFSDSKGVKNKQTIMGFVMDAISQPTPLTHMLDTEVSEKKRAKWAEEAARMVDILHQHGIIWGDAKGDNFMVDSNDDLWIIDFGGSYTEGWVDADLKETEEGDEQGLQKLCNGLEDPENNTLHDDEQEGKKASKRKRDAVDEKEQQEINERPGKLRKEVEESVENATDGPNYCYCDQPASDSMVACDGQNCKRQWFHFSCVGIAEAPATARWFCDECTKR